MLRGIVLPERYEPIRRIASGGMATVWCARDRTLDREVAIKLLAEPFAHDEVSGRRFKREARLAARLSGHSNVVTIYDVGQATSSETPLGQPFIVMEYLPGGTVSQALRGEQVDRATAVQWLHQAASALDYAHGRGVIHRDIKLANFLLDRDRVLHVADFGIAQLGTDDTLTAAGQVLGTAAYLAPERALGQPATEASDRYALAIAAFELLAAERPFTAEHFTAQARQHIEDPPPRASRRNPELPVALDAVLARGMAKRPEQRYSTASELAVAVDRALTEGPARRPFAGAATRTTRALPVAGSRVGGRGRAAAFAALAAAAVGVGIAAGASGGGTPVRSRSAARVHALGHSLAARRPAPPPPTRSTPAKPKAPTTIHAAPPPAPAPTGADALEAQGHQLMLGGNYNTAIPVLRQAVSAATPASLTYAYALYDLGHSLRLAGNPRAAVPILWRRLQIPNQTGVVRSELALALRALGQQTGGAAPGPKRSPDHPGSAAGSGQGD
jgi:tRNA A-37 threonylcarbamoyl transferase component Bud32